MLISVSVLFNASEFDEQLKIEFFKQLYRISKTHEMSFLYDYFKEPERLVNAKNIEASTLFEFYEFALQIANQNQK